MGIIERKKKNINRYNGRFQRKAGII